MKKELTPLQRQRAHIKASFQAAMKLETIGMLVDVQRDDGTILATKLASLPWTLGHGAWVAKVDGINGAYDCVRITPRGESGVTL